MGCNTLLPLKYEAFRCGASIADIYFKTTNVKVFFCHLTPGPATEKNRGTKYPQRNANLLPAIYLEEIYSVLPI